MRWKLWPAATEERTLPTTAVESETPDVDRNFEPAAVLSRSRNSSVTNPEHRGLNLGETMTLERAYLAALITDVSVNPVPGRHD